MSRILSALGSLARRLFSPLGPSAATSAKHRAWMQEQLKEYAVERLYASPQDADLNPTGETWEMRLAYRSALKEPAIKGPLLKKVYAVASLPQQVLPEDDQSPADKEAAVWVDWAISHARGGWPRLLHDCCLHPLIDGFAVGEKVPVRVDRGRWKDRWGLHAVKFKETKDIRFRIDQYRNVESVRSFAGTQGGHEFDPRDFILLTHLPLFENPFGQSDLRAAYRAFDLIKAAILLRGILLENFSGPFLVYKAGQPARIEEARKALANARSRGFIVIDESDELQVVNLATSAPDQFQSTIEDLRKEAATAIAGAYLQMLESSTPQGNSETHKGVSELFEWWLAASVGSALTEQLVPDLHDPHYPVYVGRPRILLGGVDPTKAEKGANRLRTAKELNLPVKKSQAYEIIELEPGTPGDTLSWSQPGGGQPGPGGGPTAGGPTPPPPPPAPPPGGGGTAPSAGRPTPTAGADQPGSGSVPPELLGAMVEAGHAEDWEALDRLTDLGGDPDALAAAMRGQAKQFADAGGSWEPHVVERGHRKGRTVYKNSKTGELRDHPPGQAPQREKTGPNWVERQVAKAAEHPLGQKAGEVLAPAAEEVKAAAKALYHGTAAGIRFTKKALAAASAKLDTLPGGKAVKWLGRGAVKLFHVLDKALMPAMKASWKLCEQSAYERGLSQRHVDILGKVLAAADFAGGYLAAVPGHIVGEAAAGPAGGIAAANVAGFMPTASVLYLAWSTARNPLATWRAAKRLVKARAALAAEQAKAAAGAVAKGTGAVLGAMDQVGEAFGRMAATPPTVSFADGGPRVELVDRLADSLAASVDPDWWKAVVFAGLGSGLSLPDAAAAADEHPHPPDADDDDAVAFADAPRGRQEGEVWKGQGNRWFTRKNGRVIPTRAPGTSAPDPNRVKGENPAEVAKRQKEEREPARVAARTAWHQAAADPSKVKAEHLPALAEHLKRLTRDELREIGRGLEQRVGGLKRDVVARLLAHVGADPNAGLHLPTHTALAAARDAYHAAGGHAGAPLAAADAYRQAHQEHARAVREAAGKTAAEMPLTQPPAVRGKPELSGENTRQVNWARGIRKGVLDQFAGTPHEAAARDYFEKLHRAGDIIEGRDAHAENIRKQATKATANEPTAGGTAATEPATRPDGTPLTPTPKNVYTVDPKALKTDPERFQYKVSGIKAGGVTDELKGTNTYNPELGGTLLVWRDPADGRDYVVNGHHRHELASRTGADSVNVRYIDAPTAKEARARGALANIAEGRGTAADAAKYLRDSGQDVEHLKRAGISMSGKVAQDAANLKDLSDGAFQKLTTGQLDEQKAAAVARHLKDPKLQDALFKKLDDREEAGKDWSNREIETAAKKMARAGKVTEQGKDLFGGFEDEKSTFDQEVEIESHINRALQQAANDYAAVGNVGRAERVKGAGNTLAVEENQKRRQQAQQHAETFDREAGLKGPVSEAIQAGAAKLATAKTKRDKEAAKAETLERVRGLLAGDQGGTPGEQPPEPGFTGTDRLGRKWVDGGLVAKEEEPGGEHASDVDVDVTARKAGHRNADDYLNKTMGLGKALADAGADPNGDPHTTRATSAAAGHLHEYRSKTSRTIARKLRAGEPLTPDERGQLAAVDGLANRMRVPQATKLHRVVGADVVAGLKPGDTFRDPAPAFTGLREGDVDNIRVNGGDQRKLTILADQGAPGVHVSGGEGPEVILPANAPLEVVSVSPDGVVMRHRAAGSTSAPPPASPPPPPPPPPVRDPAKPPPGWEGRRWNEVTGTLHEAISAHPTLTPEQKRAYTAAAQAATKRMPTTAVQIIKKNLKGVRFHSTLKDMVGGLADDVAKESNNPAKRAEVAAYAKDARGAYRHQSGTAYLDGEAGGGEGTYAHELTHAIDHGHAFSGSAEWQEAFREEIDQDGPMGGKLSRYARTKPSEGFAEFGRAVYTLDTAGRKRLERDFPKAAAFFKRYSLWPSQG